MILLKTKNDLLQVKEDLILSGIEARKSGNHSGKLVLDAVIVSLSGTIALIDLYSQQVKL